MSAAANRYLADKVNTATPAELVAMLFDRAVRALADAKAAFDGSRVVDASGHLVRAQDIVVELRCSLDLSTGPIAANLDALYGYVHLRLIDANLRRDRVALAEAGQILDQLRTAWRDACIGRAELDTPA